MLPGRFGESHPDFEIEDGRVEKQSGLLMLNEFAHPCFDVLLMSALASAMRSEGKRSASLGEGQLRLRVFLRFLPELAGWGLLPR